MKDLRVVAWRISGDSTRVQAFQRRLPDSSYQHGAKVETRPTSRHGSDGIVGVLKGKLFPLHVRSRTINVIRSAVSMTYKHVEGTPIGQHPLVSRLLKGAMQTSQAMLSGMWMVCFS